MDDKPSSYGRGRQRYILEYFWAFPGKVITIAELEKRFKDKYTRNQIMASMAHMCSQPMKERYNYPIEKLQQGVWRLVEPKQGETAKKAPAATEMLVEVLKERDTYLLVEDTEDGKIYKMTLVG
jgi:hypothetical protein